VSPCGRRLPAGLYCHVFLYFGGPAGTVPPRIAGLNPEQITATLNSSVSLPCDVRAHPSPEVTWYKDGWTLSLGEEIFLLPGA